MEVKEHEKVFQVDATHYVTLLTSEANTYESTSGEMRPVDLTLIPKDIEGKEEVKTPTEEEIRDPNLDLIYEPKDSSIDVSFFMRGSLFSSSDGTIPVPQKLCTESSDCLF